MEGGHRFNEAAAVKPRKAGIDDGYLSPLVRLQ